jgi:hypothetical protein
MSEMPQAKLKLCPWCGQQPRLWSNNTSETEDKPIYAYYCERLGHSIWMRSYRSLRRAAEFWNRRVK